MAVSTMENGMTLLMLIAPLQTVSASLERHQPELGFDLRIAMSAHFHTSPMTTIGITDKMVSRLVSVPKRVNVFLSLSIV